MKSIALVLCVFLFAALVIAQSEGERGSEDERRAREEGPIRSSEGWSERISDLPRRSRSRARSDVSVTDDNSKEICKDVNTLDCLAKLPFTGSLHDLLAAEEAPKQIKNLTESLKSDSVQNTLFAPIDMALFKTAMYADKSPMPIDDALIGSVLAAHMVEGSKSLDEVEKPVFWETLNKDTNFVNLGGRGQVIQVRRTGKGNFKINTCTEGVAQCEARVLIGNIKTKNGYIHLVSKVFRWPYSATAMMKRNGLSSATSILASLPGAMAYSNLSPCRMFFVPENSVLNKDFATFNAELKPEMNEQDLKDKVKKVAEYIKAHSSGAGMEDFHYPDKLADGMSIKTGVDGKDVKVSRQGDVIKFNEATVKHWSLTSNGILYVIDGPLHKSSDASASSTPPTATP